MRVRCISVVSVLGKVKTRDGRIEVGGEYLVLEIFGSVKRETVQYRLLDAERDSPGLYFAQFFEIISATIPDNWAFDFDPLKGYWSLSPVPWAGDFWWRYFESDPEAIEIFYKTLAKLEESPD